MKCIYCKKEVQDKDKYTFAITNAIAHKKCFEDFIKKEHLPLWKCIYEDK